MADEKRYVWHVEATTPDVWKHPTTGEERPTTKNLSLQVVAGSNVFDVLEAVERERGRPTVTFIKVWRERCISSRTCPRGSRSAPATAPTTASATGGGTASPSQRTGSLMPDPAQHEHNDAEERPEDTVRRYARRLVAIKEAHSPRQREHFGFLERWCRECRQDWPCPTVRVARGDDDA